LPIFIDKICKSTIEYLKLYVNSANLIIDLYIYIYIKE